MDMQSGKRRVKNLRLVEAEHVEEDCVKQEGEVLELYFPGTMKSCQLRDGNVITGRCHADSSDTELQELFEDSVTIHSTKAAKTSIFKCASQHFINKKSQVYCDLENFKTENEHYISDYWTLKDYSLC